MALHYLLDDGAILALHGLVDGIRVVLALHRAVGGHADDVQAVDFGKLGGLGAGGTGHTGQLFVHTEVVLEGDGSQRLAFGGDLHALLGLDGLMQAFVVAAADHQTAGELVHDDDLTILDYIVDIPLHYAVGLDSLIDVVGKGHVLGGGKVSFYLAKTLIKSGANVKIIEKNPERCNFLSEAIPGAVIIQGDCMDQSLLLSEGVEHADGIAALMDYDEENIIITMYLKGITKAKLITKVNNASFDPLLHDQNFECIIHPKSLTGEYIARYIRAMQNTGDSNVESLYRLNDDKVEALEFKVNAESRVTNVPIMSLNLKANLQIICINRGGKIILPQGTDVIKPEDTVIVLTMQKGLSKLEDIVKR